jgi:hypothetical protein
MDSCKYIYIPVGSGATDLVINILAQKLGRLNKHTVEIIPYVIICDEVVQNMCKK